MSRPWDRNGYHNAFSLVGCLAALALSTSAPAVAAYTGKTLYAFCSMKLCRDGSNSNGLMIDAAGNLFGVTSLGGKHSDAGVVYEFVPSTGQYTVLHNFCSRSDCKDGARPYRVNLVIDVNGNLYGTTSKGGNKRDAGVVFELLRTDSGWHEITLYDFCSQPGCGDGASPFDGLTYAGASSGQLYDGVSPLFGTTYYSGGGGGGDVFSLTPRGSQDKWTEQVLYSFCSQADCADGAAPDTPLYIDGQGNIYGTTTLGGQNNEGVVFELSGSGSAYNESVLYSFCALQNCSDGAQPLSGVIMDGTGNLFGAAAAGGEGVGSGYGVLFELSLQGSQWQFSNLADFDGTNGWAPLGALMIDSDGNLVGTTATGGTKQKGNVFEFSAGVVQNLHSLCSGKKCRDGSITHAGVVGDAAGNFYGVTEQAGAHNAGAIFEISP